MGGFRPHTKNKSQQKNYLINRYLMGVYMSNVQELELAVSQLSANELQQFSEWFEEFIADQWDQKIAADVFAGRLVNQPMKPFFQAKQHRCEALCHSGFLVSLSSITR